MKRFARMNLRGFGMLLSICGLALGTFAGAAEAKAHTPSLQITSPIPQQQHSPIEYAVSVPRNETALLQARTSKTAWETIAKLKSGHRSTVTPDLNAGTYLFRITIVKGHQPVVTSKTVTVKVSAPAPAPPAVAFTLPTTADAGVAIPYSWSIAKIPAGDSLVLQQPEGTAKVWQTITTLPAASGSSSLSGLPLGRGYEYRVAVVDGVGNVLTDKQDSIDVYGQVPFTTLYEDDTSPGTYSTPTTAFPYSLEDNFGDITTDTEFSVSAGNNDCNAVHVSFVAGTDSPQGWSSDADLSITLEVVQQSQNPVSSVSAINVPAVLDAPLIPGQSWSLQATPSYNTNDDYNPFVYIDGYAMCDGASKNIADNG